MLVFLKTDTDAGRFHPGRSV